MRADAAAAPVGVIARSLAAAAAGTAAMDLYWYARYRAGGGESGPLRWEVIAEEDWEKISTPGRLGKRLVEAFTGQPLAPRWAPLVNNVMHWGYGLGWGAVYGTVAGSLRRSRAAHGVLFGSAVWLTGLRRAPPGQAVQADVEVRRHNAGRRPRRTSCVRRRHHCHVRSVDVTRSV